jgi:hypothetical protein
MSASQGDSIFGFATPGSTIWDSEILLSSARRWPTGTMLPEEDKGPPRDGSITAPIREEDLPDCVHAPGGAVPIGRLTPLEGAVLHGLGFVVRVTGRSALDIDGKRWVLVFFCQRGSLVKAAGWLPVGQPARRVVFKHESQRPAAPANVALVASHGVLTWLTVYEGDAILGHLIGGEPLGPLVDSWARGERALLTTDQARAEWKSRRDALSVQYGLSLPDGALKRGTAPAPRA